MAKALSFGVIAGVISPDARAAVEAARQAGFAGLQFDAIGPSLDLTALSGTGRREFRHVLKQQDEVLIGLRTEVGVHGLESERDVDRIIWRLDKILETAAGLAAPLVCLDIGPLPPPDKMAIIAAPLIELGECADRYGVIVALRSESSGMDAVLSAIALAACPWFGIDFDPLVSGSIDVEIAKAASLIRHIRGRDGIPGGDRRSKPAAIGSGNIDWSRLLGALDESHFQGWITLEGIEPAAGLKYLRGISA
jgi:sugar phosphate isomerase/epimerase